MSDTVRLAWMTDDYDVFTFRVAAPGDTPTIEVDVHRWGKMATLRLDLQRLEAPLVEQAREAEQAYWNSRPRSTMFTPEMQHEIIASVNANLQRQSLFMQGIGRDYGREPVAGLTIDARLPERYRPQQEEPKEGA